MTYAYGMKGAPAVGNGLGGLPRREEKSAEEEAVPVQLGLGEYMQVPYSKTEQSKTFSSGGRVCIAYPGNKLTVLEFPVSEKLSYEHNGYYYTWYGDNVVRKIERNSLAVEKTVSFLPGVSPDKKKIIVTDNGVYLCGKSTSTYYIFLLDLDLNGLVYKDFDATNYPQGDFAANNDGVVFCNGYYSSSYRTQFYWFDPFLTEYWYEFSNSSSFLELSTACDQTDKSLYLFYGFRASTYTYTRLFRVTRGGFRAEDTSYDTSRPPLTENPFLLSDNGYLIYTNVWPNDPFYKVKLANEEDDLTNKTVSPTGNTPFDTTVETNN